MTLSEWLKATGTSPAEVADVLGVSRQTVYAWLNREYYPSYEHLIALKELSQNKVALESFKVETCNG